MATVLTLAVAIRTSYSAIPVTCWDAAAEFNDSANPDAANPSGVWSYGWKKTPTDRFFLALTALKPSAYICGWSNASGYPLIVHNSRSVEITAGLNPIVYRPRELLLHPGLDGEYAVLRFTAPASGSYKVSGRFYGLDDNGKGTTTDVWLLANNRRAGSFTGKVNSHAGPCWASFTSHTFVLKAGDTLDFQVGYGASKNYQYDATGLVALIEEVK